MPTQSSNANYDFLAGGGECGRLMRAKDWSKTALGDPGWWPESLKTAVRIILKSSQPMFVWWDEQLISLHNDAYRIIAGAKHPAALGEPAAKIWQDIWDQAHPQPLSSLVYNSGIYNEVLLRIMQHQGYSEGAYYTFSYSPVIDSYGEVTGVICTYSDNSARIAEERQQLMDSERRFRFMSESMPQKIFTALPDGTINYFNPQWQSYSGVPINDLLKGPATWTSLIHDDDLKQLSKVWKSAFNKPRQVEYEFRMRRRDASYRWHFGRMRPMKNDDGNVIVWVGSVTDIHDMRVATERRHELELSTAALTEQRSQLLALNQAKDEFISLASHQLRTPATGVKQYLSMLIEGYAGPITPDQKNFLATAYESNERQINIVNDLLQIARIDAGKVTLHSKTTDLVRLVKNVINEHASRFNERQQVLALRVNQEELKLKIDADRIHMVLDNIIDNASKYTQLGKRITITIGVRAGKAYVSVADQGVGMTKEEIGRIFQKFLRLENPQVKGVEGSGLGLYWARKIVDLHEGSITVRSTSGIGTTFTVILPL